MQKRWIALLGVLGTVCVALAAYAAAPQWDMSIAIVDSAVPSRQATVTTGGALLVDGSAAGGGTVTLGAGSAIAGKFGIDQTTPGTTNLVAAGQNGTWTVQPGNTANTTPWLVTPVPGSSGSCTPYHLAGGTAASTNATNIKASAGTLCHLTAINTTVTIYYLRMYNLASAPTCSSATGAVHTYPVLPSGGINIPLPVGETYSTGIGFCVTGGGADTDNTNAATGVWIEASYR